MLALRTVPGMQKALNKCFCCCRVMSVRGFPLFLSLHLNSMIKLHFKTMSRMPFKIFQNIFINICEIFIICENLWNSFSKYLPNCTYHRLYIVICVNFEDDLKTIESKKWILKVLPAAMLDYFNFCFKKCKTLFWRKNF